MPSFALRLTGLLIVAVTVVMACISPVTAAAAGEYATVLKVLSGTVAIAGSLCLTVSIGRTFLRSGGVGTFKAAYVAAMALSGVGLAETLSAFQPVNMGNVLMAYCVVAIVSGAIWVRFYGCAA